MEIGPHAGDLATLDPALINFTVDYDRARLIFPGLVTLDEQNRVVEWAAESHEVSSDRLTYTFHLRRGMTWSDGTPLDASTFACSINRALDPCAGSDFASYLYNIKGAAAFNEGHCPVGAIKSAATLVGISLVAPDPLTLRIVPERPAGYFLAALTYPTLWAVPQALVERYTTPAPPPSYPGQFLSATSTWTDHLADNGGFGGNLFKLAKWDHAGHLDLERTNRCWGQKPLLPRIEYTLHKYPDGAWNAYKAGSGDAVTPYPQNAGDAKTLTGSTYHAIPQLAAAYAQPNWRLARSTTSASGRRSGSQSTDRR